MTPTQLLLADRLGADLTAHIRTQRGNGMSWDAIASHLSTLTGVSVNGESVRRWYAEEVAA
jgi:hypothetical protein